MNGGHSPHDTLRLGTRASPLALAQSRLIERALKAAHPHLQVETVEFATRGDRDRATPLSTVKDAQFFSDELDNALVSGQVDFCVHSWKDIDGPRPDGIVRAAVPPRGLPHDLILFRPDITDRLQTGERLRIGTSSLRRQLNTADFLCWALPHPVSRDDLEFVPLRGPVHERAARVLQSLHAGGLDAVVLAMAGLERLWQDPAGRTMLEPVMRQARRMVMPLSAAPAAAAQGALAVETRADNPRCRAWLAALHDPTTEQLVQLEQNLLQEYDPDRSGRFGATAIPDAVFGHIAFVRGRSAGHTEPLQFIHTGLDEAPPPQASAWDGKLWFDAVRKHVDTALAAAACRDASAVFIAHADALDGASVSTLPHYWTSGCASWKRLARQGIWVEGCADNLGYAAVENLLRTPVLGLPPAREWTVLTHRDAVPSWRDSGVGCIVPTYRIDVRFDATRARKELAGYTHFYWASARQYAALREYLPAHAQHACGPGKTLRSLRSTGLSDVRPFPSRAEWHRWAA